MENWKKWPRNDGWEISDQGRVRIAGTGLVKKLTKTKDGYLKTTIGGIEWFIHRAVLETFRPIAHSDKMTVNHINMEKTDNRLGNLEWCTNSENCVAANDVNFRGLPAKPIDSPIAKRLRVEALLYSLDDKMAVAFDLLEKMR